LPEREPDKNPTLLEKYSLTKEFYRALIQGLKAARDQLAEHRAQREAERLEKEQRGELVDDNDILFKVTPSQKKEVVREVDYINSSLLLVEYMDSSEQNSRASLSDSIRNQGDFLLFE
jgi:hypothetical protein